MHRCSSRATKAAISSCSKSTRSPGSRPFAWTCTRLTNVWYGSVCSLSRRSMDWCPRGGASCCSTAGGSRPVLESRRECRRRWRVAVLGSGEPDPEGRHPGYSATRLRAGGFSRNAPVDWKSTEARGLLSRTSGSDRPPDQGLHDRTERPGSPPAHGGLESGPGYCAQRRSRTR